jgi:hypothetical protein
MSFPRGMENQLKKPTQDMKMKKMVAAKMNILEENLGIRSVGKKVVGTFDLSVPEKNKDHENLAWI